jgi:hypothetical protein
LQGATGEAGGREGRRGSNRSGVIINARENGRKDEQIMCDCVTDTASGSESDARKALDRRRSAVWPCIT